MKKHFEVFIAMNEDGDYGIGLTEEEASEHLAESRGGYQCRVVRIGGMMTPPALIAKVVDIPDDAGKTVEIEGGEQ